MRDFSHLVFCEGGGGAGSCHSLVTTSCGTPGLKVCVGDPIDTLIPISFCSTLSLHVAATSGIHAALSSVHQLVQLKKQSVSMCLRTCTRVFASC